MFNEIIANHLNKLHPHEEPLIMSKDSFFLMNIVLYLKKGSPLIHPINTQFHKMKTSGLIDLIVDHYRGVNYKKLPQRKLPQKMTIDHLEGIFYVCAAFYSCAFVVFVLEPLVYTVKRFR